MADFNIPQRAKNESEFPQLKKVDKLTVCAAVLMGLPNQEAYKLFHPEYLDHNGKLNESGRKASSQFWNYGKTRDYRESYEATLAEFLGRAKQTSHKVSEDIDDSRKDKALKSLLNQAMSLVEGGTELDPDTLRTIADIFKRLGILKENEVQQEAPRRYIPLRCRQECQYRFFVEKYVETGEIVSDCEYCKALAIARKHGYHYDPTTNLSIPTETEEPKENNPE